MPKFRLIERGVNLRLTWRKPHEIFQITDTSDFRARVALRPRPKNDNILTRSAVFGGCGWAPGVVVCVGNVGGEGLAFVSSCSGGNDCGMIRAAGGEDRILGASLPSKLWGSDGLSDIRKVEWTWALSGWRGRSPTERTLRTTPSWASDTDMQANSNVQRSGTRQYANERPP